MKKLILIRHAKSSWEFNTSDLQRPLSERGINDAEIMSKVLKNLSIEVDVVFHSIAKRTAQTCEIFIRNMSIKRDRIFEKKDLYDFSGNKVYEFITRIDNKFNSVMIFSHNNSCTNLLSKLAKVNTHVPTCGVLIFNFDVSLWSKINLGICQKFFPKHYR